jgi:hypothetical protein
MEATQATGNGVRVTRRLQVLIAAKVREDFASRGVHTFYCDGASNVTKNPAHAQHAQDAYGSLTVAAIARDAVRRHRHIKRGVAVANDVIVLFVVMECD